MQLEDVISEKKLMIEEATGNVVNIRENDSLRVRQLGACIDFDTWDDTTNFQLILHRLSINRVHILHELIHLEKFFIDQYCLVACPQQYIHELRETINIFKNIPEDYVAHKVIRDIYNFDPIDRNWFVNADTLIAPPIALAANLVKYHTYIEFCTEYIERYERFRARART